MYLLLVTAHVDANIHTHTHRTFKKSKSTECPKLFVLLYFLKTTLSSRQVAPLPSLPDTPICAESLVPFLSVSCPRVILALPLEGRRNLERVLLGALDCVHGVGGAAKLDVEAENILNEIIEYH